MSSQQFQEQCAVELEKLDCAHGCGIGSEIAQKIRTMPMTEVKDEHIGYFRGDKNGNLIWGEDCVCRDPVFPCATDDIDDDGAPTISIPIYRYPPDAEALIQENQGLRLRLAAAENGTKEAAKAEQLYRDAEQLLTADEKQLHAELSALRNESEAFRQESAESDRVNYSARCSLQADINDRDEIISNGKDRIRTLEAKVSELRTTLKTVMQMQVRGHQLQDRLQFSNAGREILGKVNAAMKGGAA